MSGDEQSALVTVAIGHSMPETLAAVSMLRSYGVEATTNPYQHAALYPHLMTALGGIRIQVRREDYALAAELLAVEPEAAAPRESLAGRIRRLGLHWVAFLFAGVAPPAPGMITPDAAAQAPEGDSA